MFMSFFPLINLWKQSPTIHKTEESDTWLNYHTASALQGRSPVTASRLPGDFPMTSPCVSASHYPAALSSSITVS